MSDHAPSLSIASLSFDPTAGRGDTVAIAGVGNRSSFHKSGPLTGLLVSRDGGRRWHPIDLPGRDISGAAIRGDVVVVTSRGGTHRGVFVRRKPGGRFTRAFATPARSRPVALSGPAFDLVGDPRRPRRLYAAVGGAHGGVFRSDDAGRHWVAQGDGTFGTGRLLVRKAVNLRLAVRHPAGGLGTVWAAVAINAVASLPGGFVLVGRDDGLWVTGPAHLGTWKRVSGPLPNVVVETLEFDPVDGTLLAGTLGRGAWTLAHAPEAISAAGA